MLKYDEVSYLCDIAVLPCHGATILLLLDGTRFIQDCHISDMDGASFVS